MKSQHIETEDIKKQNFWNHNITIGIIPTIAITVILAFYNFCISVLNGLYWYLQDSTWLNFKASPIQTPFLEAIIFFYLLFILVYIWHKYQHITQKNVIID